MSYSIFHQPEMKNSQRTGVRQYNKSEFPRLRWTPELHDHFVEVVERLGGKYSKPFSFLWLFGSKKVTEKTVYYTCSFERLCFFCGALDLHVCSLRILPEKDD